MVASGVATWGYSKKKINHDNYFLYFILYGSFPRQVVGI